MNRRQHLNEKLKVSIEEVSKEASRIDITLAPFAAAKLEHKVQKKELLKLTHDLPKSQASFQSFIPSEIKSLQRRIEILKERSELFKVKSREAKALAFQIQAAETKLRHKAKYCTKIRSEWSAHSEGKNVIASEVETLAHQVRFMARQNEELETVSLRVR
eukprot:TRINITY_DN12608_c0_g2_i1.p1 TRINITY_DN12608_c0_g2~~TRINITY_DN12608_c0_g2_i1.p1  ORF type:complete len:160 (+),score=29.61 TRINITY_DN12608_c0_g2_i1:508-987(+)